MAFDECVKIPAERDYVRHSCDRTYRWLVRCRDEFERLTLREASPPVPSMVRDGFHLPMGNTDKPSPCPPCPPPALFGINQGADFEDIRVAHMRRIAELDLPGYAIGGLAVGETTQQMYDIIEVVEEHMPEDRPRYLMGVGTPQNIIEAVARGIDFFDCVMPARNGRHGRLFTWGGLGSININNEKYKDDNGPIDAECGCPVCRTFSRAYIRHLFKAGEMLAMRLAVLHNLYFYNTLMERIRGAIDNGTFDTLARSMQNQ